ncbi:MAG: lamin tail domain-containing protein [Aigarchaeota archaeon]|nr:lamin tail domain-containing protein [Aigarchaeota archaeon]MDW8092699.1 lamin tail domain-containing protein [Nitrososphaerota archaeon]
MFPYRSERHKVLLPVIIIVAIAVGVLGGFIGGASAFSRDQISTVYATETRSVYYTVTSPIILTQNSLVFLTIRETMTQLQTTTSILTEMLRLTVTTSTTLTTSVTTTSVTTHTSISTVTYTQSFTTTRIIESRPIIINEVESNPPSGSREWIELYNPNSFPVNVGRWKLFAGIMLLTTIPNGTVIQPNGYVVIEMSSGDFIPNSNACIILRDTQEHYINGTPCVLNSGLTDLFSNDFTLQRVPDGSDIWDLRRGTRGEPNR